jgi:hypothetical protein
LRWLENASKFFGEIRMIAYADVDDTRASGQLRQDVGRCPPMGIHLPGLQSSPRATRFEPEASHASHSHAGTGRD